MENKTIGIIIGAVILIIVGYMIYNAGPVVSAQGTSEIEVMPDLVSVNLNVQSKGNTLQETQEMNQEISDALIVELIRIGFDEDELRFVNYNVYPQYDYGVILPGGNYKEKGYVVSQQLVVKTSDVQKVLEIVNAAVNSGSLVQYIQFEVSEDKQKEYKKQALEEASRDAREKAQAIADGQGRKLGRLVAINNQDFYYPGPIALFEKAAGNVGGALEVDMNAEAARAASSINPQDIKVTATINAQYKLLIF